MKPTNIMKEYKDGCDERGTQSSVPHHFQEKSPALGKDEPKWAYRCPPGLSVFSIHRLYPPLHEHHFERGYDSHSQKTNNTFLPVFILLTSGLLLKANMK